MNITTTVSLGNFYLFSGPSSYASNSHYIGSESIQTLGSFLIGANRLYQYKTTNLWILKGILKDNVLLLDNSFGDPDFLNEQLAILEFVGTPAKVQYECLWTYFNLPSVEEINRISLQVTQRKVDEFTTPEKVYYYKCLDRGIFNGTYDEWIVEMDVLFEKWKNCERLRLTERGHTTSQIEYYIDDKNTSSFKRQYANDQITFYVSQRINETLFSTEEVKSMMSELNVISQTQYEDSLLILVEATNMDVPTILPEDIEDLNTYISSINRLLEDEDNVNYDDVARHATVVYNYHRNTQPVLADVDHPF